MRKLILALACAAGTLAVPAVPAMARDNDRIYDRQGRYVQPRAVRANDRVWRGNDGRYYCKRDNGTTGLIIGGAAAINLAAANARSAQSWVQPAARCSAARSIAVGPNAADCSACRKLKGALSGRPFFLVSCGGLITPTGILTQAHCPAPPCLPFLGQPTKSPGESHDRNRPRLV
jgi:hypothetical protein